MLLKLDLGLVTREGLFSVKYSIVKVNLPNLLEWLKKINMTIWHETLVEAGFDDIESMLF